MINLLHRTAKSAKGKMALTLLGVLALAFSAGIVYAAKGKPDFKLTVTKSKSVAAGGSTTFTVKVKRLNGFKKNITLGVKGLPGGAKAGWKSKTKVKGKVIAAAGCKKHCNVLDPKTSSATLTITTSNGTPIGSDDFQVTGKGGGVSHTLKGLTLIVQPPAGTNNNNTGNGGNNGGSAGNGSLPPGTAPAIVPSVTPTFAVSPTPSTENVVQTDTTSYTINIDRSGGFTGAVSFGVSGLPTGATATFSPASTTTGNSVTMNVQTDDTTPTGNHTLTVTGSGSGTPDQSTPVTLSVQQHVPFGIAGSASGVSPGADTPLDLTLTNPYNFSLQVTGLTVALNGITGAGSAHGGCNSADFSVTDINAAALPITLPANATNASLTSLGVVTANLPKLHMDNSSSNQDDCQGATVNFNFTGAAQK
jgi:hypothetical protein